MAGEKDKILKAHKILKYFFFVVIQLQYKIIPEDTENVDLNLF